MKKRKLLLAMLALFGVSMVQAQSYYAKTTVQQSGTYVSADGTAGFDISSADAVMQFDTDGNAYMTINDGSNDVVVAKIPCAGSSTDGGELVGEPTTTAVTTNLSYTIPTGNYGTLYSPFQVQVPSNASFYAPKLNGAKNLVLLNSNNQLSPNAVVPVWTPIVIYGTAGSSFNISFSATAGTAQTTDGFGGTVLATAFPTESNKTLCTMGSVKKTVSSVETTKYGFYKYEGSMTATDKFPASKVWLFLTTPTSAKAAADFAFEEVTAINDVDANVDVNANKDGKYLENGRIVIVKGGKKYFINGQEVK